MYSVFVSKTPFHTFKQLCYNVRLPPGFLQKAGNAVKKATEALVNAARSASQGQDDTDLIAINQRRVGGIAQVCPYPIIENVSVRNIDPNS